jgi:hypothetical protein
MALEMVAPLEDLIAPWLIATAFDGQRLPAQNFRKNQRRHNRSVGFDDKLRRLDVQLAPGDLLVRHCAGI